MNKTIRNVFLVIGVLLLCLIIWFFVFNNGLFFVYDAIRTVINGGWQAVTGQSDLLPEWNKDDENDAGGNIGEATGNVGGL